MSEFRDAIEAQLSELKTAKSADDVLRTLSDERNPYGPDWDGRSGDAFFAGGDGDDMRDALEEAAWEMEWWKADYHWCMKAPDGSMVTYVEGDIYRGNPTSQR